MAIVKKILEPQGEQVGEHPSIEDLALFVEGKLSSSDKRKNITEHLASCKVCYEVVQQTLGDIEAEKKEVKEKLTPVKGKRVFAIAASVILCVIIGTGVWFKGGLYQQPPAALTATIEIDEELRELFLEDESLEWTGEKAERFAQMLANRGVEVAGADTVTLMAMYDPYVTKSLKKTKELIIVKITDGKIVIEIKQ